MPTLPAETDAALISALPRMVTVSTRGRSWILADPGRDLPRGRRPRGAGRGRPVGDLGELRDPIGSTREPAGRPGRSRGRRRGPGRLDPRRGVRPDRRLADPRKGRPPMTPSDLDLDRRRFLGGSATLALGLASPGASGWRRGPGPRTPGLTDTSASPHAIVRSIGLGEARWTRGFWAERFESLLQVDTPASLGHDERGRAGPVLSEPPDRRRGLAEGKHRGPGWNDGDFYKWVEAASATYRDHQGCRPRPSAGRGDRGDRRRPGFRRLLALARSRSAAVNGDRAAAPFRDRLDFETYNLGHLITAACVHHRATGKDTLLGAASKAARFLAEAVRTKADRPGPGRRLPVPLHGGRRALSDDPRPGPPGPRPQADRPPGSRRGRLGRQPGPHPLPSPGDGRRPRRPGQLPLRRGGRPRRGDRRPDPDRAAPQDLGRRRFPQALPDRGLRGPLRRGLARRRRRTRRPSPASIRPTGGPTSCPTARPTTRRARRSATSSGTGGC